MRSRIPSIYDDGEPIPQAWDLRCQSCGYSLTGLTERRCPECGNKFHPRDIWETNRSAPEVREVTLLDQILLWVLVGVVTILVLFAVVAHNNITWVGLVIIVLAEANILYARSDRLPMRLIGIGVGVAVLIAVMLF